MTDAGIAKQTFSGGEYTCVFVLGGKAKCFNRKGIGPLLEIAESGELKGLSAADKIVGRAAALIYAYMDAKYVYAEVLSESAEQVLCSRGIEYEYGEKTGKIVNRKGDGMCPMEQTVLEISDPGQAVTALREKLNKLKAPNG